MTLAVSATCSANAEQRGHPVTVVRMMGLETASAILGGHAALASALDITPRAVRYKLAGERGIADTELILAAQAVERKAQRLIDHAFKLREEARPTVDQLAREMAMAPENF